MLELQGGYPSILICTLPSPCDPSDSCSDPTPEIVNIITEEVGKAEGMVRR